MTRMHIYNGNRVGLVIPEEADIILLLLLKPLPSASPCLQSLENIHS